MRKPIVLFAITLAIALGGLTLISWRKKAGNMAAQFLDIAEVGNNAGFSNSVFAQMMKSVGWKGGEAWCMYFAKSIYLKAFPKKASEIEKVLTGSTQQSWKNAMARPDLFKVITDGQPQKGDIAIWQSVNNSGLGHAGIVYKRLGNDQAETIEANSGLGGTREGQGIVKNVRSTVPGTVEGSLKLLGFLRLKTSII